MTMKTFLENVIFYLFFVTHPRRAVNMVREYMAAVNEIKGLKDRVTSIRSLLNKS